MKFFNTIPFCEVLTDADGQPISMAEQQDANEFFNNLFDKLEQELGSSQVRVAVFGLSINICMAGFTGRFFLSQDQDVLKRLFGGTNSYQARPTSTTATNTAEKAHRKKRNFCPKMGLITDVVAVGR